MSIWAWLALYFVGFALLQLLIYRYLDGDVERASPNRATAHDRGAFDPEFSDADHDDDGRYCRHCGTRNENDSAFTYCRECVEPL